MSDSDANVPVFKTYKDGESIPPVDPLNIKRTWEYDRTHSRVGVNGCQWLQDRRAVCGPGADVDDVCHRCAMIETLTDYSDAQLLAPWKHGEILDDAVFHVAATFPLQFLAQKDYKMPGDYLFPFNLNAFVQRLIEETGIAHTWEPVQIRFPEEGRCWVMDQPEVDSPETKAKVETRQLLWMIWERCSGGLVDSPLKRHPEALAGLFADFLIENLDLVREVETSFGTAGGPSLELLQKVEQRAVPRWFR